MHTLDHLRWHLTFALGGALAIHWLPWHLTAIMIALIVGERGLWLSYRQLRRKRELASDNRFVTAREDVDRRADDPPSADRTRSRLSMALRRLLGANCAWCHGFGCPACAETGLR